MLESEMLVNPGQSCQTILLVRLSHLSDYRIELSVRTRAFLERRPSRWGEINAGTIDQWEEWSVQNLELDNQT